MSLLRGLWPSHSLRVHSPPSACLAPGPRICQLARSDAPWVPFQLFISCFLIFLYLHNRVTVHAVFGSTTRILNAEVFYALSAFFATHLWRRFWSTFSPLKHLPQFNFHTVSRELQTLSFLAPPSSFSLSLLYPHTPPSLSLRDSHRRVSDTYESIPPYLFPTASCWGSSPVVRSSYLYSSIIMPHCQWHSDLLAVPVVTSERVLRGDREREAEWQIERERECVCVCVCVGCQPNSI